MSKDEKAKALEKVKKAMIQLRYQEHTNESLTTLVKAYFSSPTQFQHFLDI